MNRPTVFLFHGYGGKKTIGWLSWLEAKLVADGYTVIAPEFPNPYVPEIGAWEASLAPYKDKLQGSIVIAYSLSGILALQLIQKYQLSLSQLICIALPINKLEGKTLESLYNKVNEPTQKSLKQFVDQPLEWETIQTLCQEIHIVLSTDDYAIPYKETYEYYFQHLPAANLLMLRDKGHFNTKHHVLTLPEVLSLVIKPAPLVSTKPALFGIIDPTPMDHKTSKRRRIRRAFNFKPGKILSPNKLLKWGVIALIGLIIAVPLLFVWYSRDLPTPGTLVVSKYKDATRIYDRKGVLLYSVFQDENRTYVKISQIPKNLQNATIAIEDENFYKNNGFDPIGILRAARDSVLNRSISGGGSTITQQLVKNVLLSNEQVLSRKIKELILAIQVDQKYSKDEILEMYLNNIPYGGTAVGVEAASEQYFGKKAKDLNLAQSAFLAGLPQSPSLYSPFTGEKYYLDRTKDVLRQMRENGYITKKQETSAYDEINKYSFKQKDIASIKAPHFVMFVRDVLVREFGEQMVTSGGLQVTTSLDYELQKEAETIVKEEVDKLEKYKATNGAAVVTDPKTGEILAMVGSKDYFDEENDGNFNVATSDKRQPGSALKPVMYAAALEKGYTASTLLMDTKTEFPSVDSSIPTYIPVNYDGKFRGPVQVRYALGNSLNIPAVKLLAMVGLEPVMKKGYEMGIESWEPTKENQSRVGLSLVLGGRESSLLNQMTAYGVFANKGIRQDPVSVIKVTDINGKKLFEHNKKEGPKVLSEDVAFIISHILLDNSARAAAFGARSALTITGKNVSVKTGTTDEKRDNWTFGYTPSYVVGVWVGNNDNTPMNAQIASGITGASPIWNKIMTHVLKDKGDEQPKKPDNVVALQIDSLAGGLPHGGQPTRSEYFVKGTEPSAESPVYKSKDGENYLVFKEDDPISSDGQNRWQKGIDEWIEQNHKDNKMYHPPGELKEDKKEEENKPDEPTPTPSPTPAVQGSATTPTPTP